MAKHKKSNHGKFVVFALFMLLVLGVTMTILVRGNDVILFNPKGKIAAEQYNLLVTSTLIMTGFAVLVLAALYFFAWKYRETNSKTEFNIRAGRSKKMLALTWLSPILVFALLVSIMLPATQRLEPQKSIASDKKEMTIRVIAMRWKWVFLYPDHDIATVNFVQVPEDTPLRFELTADEAPMNSFWIPHLGGMLYAMTEHVNQLNLIAAETGDYPGGAAEINGHGFAGMRFVTRVSTQDDFDKWVAHTAENSSELDAAEYGKLLEPSENNPAVTYFSPSNGEIFTAMLEKYATGSHSHYSAPASEGHGGH